MLLRAARPAHPARSARPALLSLLIVSLAGAMLALVAGPAQAVFTDTAGTHYEDAVSGLVERDVLVGCAPGEFCGDEAMTRGQFATVLVAVMDLHQQTALTRDDTSSEGTAGDADAGAADDGETDAGDAGVEAAGSGGEVQSAFIDVAGTTHADSIELLAEAGITNGCSEDSFCPRDEITRAQFATLLATAFGIEPTDERFFDDVDGVHADGVNRLAAVGIAAGCGSPLTAFCGDQGVKRSHVALFLARTIGIEDPVELSSLEERRELQAELDAEEEARRAAAEAEAQAEAEADAARDKVWDDLAMCESGGNWSINTGNGYYGGLQFALRSWRAVGGSGYPHHHSREEQIYRAEKLLEIQGWGAWPACSLKLGYR